MTQNGTGEHFCNAKISVKASKDFSPPDISFSSCTCVPLVSKETEIPIPLIVLMSVTYKQRGVHVTNYIKIINTAHGPYIVFSITLQSHSKNSNKISLQQDGFLAACNCIASS
jgi:uncharacterized Fe-S cluster-containing protein